MIYDLHTHTKYSPCSNLKPEIILKIAKKRKLNGIAITDHNTTKGAIEVAKLNKDKDFEVIIADEIKTQYGDVLVYYIQEEITSKDLFIVLDKAKEQDAILAIAHPFRPLSHVRFKYPIKDISKKIHAIESLNARTFFWENNKAINVADQLNLAKIAGSDAHFGFEIGNAITQFDGSLREAIKKRKTIVSGHSLISPIGITFSSILRRIK